MEPPIGKLKQVDSSGAPPRISITREQQQLAALTAIQEATKKIGKVDSVLHDQTQQQQQSQDDRPLRAEQSSKQQSVYTTQTKQLPQRQLPERPQPPQQAPQQQQQLPGRPPPRGRAPERPSPPQQAPQQQQQLPGQPPPRGRAPERPSPPQIPERQPPQRQAPERPPLQQQLPDRPPPQQPNTDRSPPQQQAPLVREKPPLPPPLPPKSGSHQTQNGKPREDTNESYTTQSQPLERRIHPQQTEQSQNHDDQQPFNEQQQNPQQHFQQQQFHKIQNQQQEYDQSHLKQQHQDRTHFNTPQLNQKQQNLSQNPSQVQYNQTQYTQTQKDQEHHYQHQDEQQTRFQQQQPPDIHYSSRASQNQQQYDQEQIQQQQTQQKIQQQQIQQRNEKPSGYAAETARLKDGKDQDQDNKIGAFEHLNIPKEPQATWDLFLNNIIGVISELNIAAKNDQKSQFSALTTDITENVRVMLQCSGTLSQESPILNQNPELKLVHHNIRSTLSKLRLASFIASGIWPPPDAIMNMRYGAGQVLLAIRNFVVAAQQAGITELESPTLMESITRSKSWAVLFDQSRDVTDEFSDREITERLGQSSNDIVAHVSILVGRISQEARTSQALIEKAKDIVNEAGQLLSLLDDVQPGDSPGKSGVDNVLSDFIAKKDSLYVAVNDLVTAARTTMDTFAPPNALTLLMNSATSVLKSVEELILSTRALLDQKEGLELLRLQRQVENLEKEDSRKESTLGQLHRRAQSLTFENAEEVADAGGIAVENAEESPTTSTNSLSKEQRSSSRSSKPATFGGNVRGTSSNSLKAAKLFGEQASKVEQVAKGAIKNAEADLAQRPFFLQHDYGPNDITYGADKQINGATFGALVERLVPHDIQPDPNFVTIFMMTFRCFSTPRDLLDELIRRASLPQPAGLTPEEAVIWVKEKQTPIRLRVCNIVKMWLESYYYDEQDDALLTELSDFATGPIFSETLTTVSGAKMLETINKKINEIEPTRQLKSKGSMVNLSAMNLAPGKQLSKSKSTDRFDRHLTGAGNYTFANDNRANAGSSTALNNNLPPPPATIIPRNFAARTGWPLLDLDPLEIARQITIMEMKIFCKIRPCELINLEFSKKNTTIAVNVRAMSTFSTQMTNWVAETILNEIDMKKRCALIKHFIKIGERCMGLQNYDALMAILCAINSSTIARLKDTWALLGKAPKTSLELLRKATEHTRNYTEYRNRLKESLPPCLPYVGLFLTDLTFTEDGNVKYRGAKELKLINFDKYSKTAKIIQDLQRWQVPYNLQELPEMREYLRDSLERSKNGGDLGELYRVSLLIEPRKNGEVEEGFIQLGFESATIAPVHHLA